jgi:ATP-dependent Zn protease
MRLSSILRHVKQNRRMSQHRCCNGSRPDPLFASMTRVSQQRQHTAIHEAGHAVIGRVLKQVCGQATIRQNRREGEAGYHFIADPHVTHYHWEKLARYRKYDQVMLGRIMSFMAGREAEEEVFGACAGGDEDDEYQVDLMLNSLLPPDIELSRYRLYHQRLCRHTRGLVRRHRAKIERVAALLLEHKTLKAEDIDRAVRGEPVRRPPRQARSSHRLRPRG